MAQYWEDWSGHTLGSAPTGWTERYNSVRSRTVVEDVDGPAGRALLTGTLTNDQFSVLSWDAIDADANKANCKIRALVKAPAYRSVNSASFWGVAARASGATIYAYTAQFRQTTNSVDSKYLTLREYSAGTGIQNAISAIGLYTPGELYWIGLEVVGTALRLTLAAKATPETLIADLNVTDATLSDGWVGLFNYSNSTEDFRVYAVGVGTNGDAAPISGPGGEVSFSGTVPTQNTSEGASFSLNLSSYFDGTATPFTYSVQSGTLPAGLTLNSSTGVISGTPTTPGTSSGIVIRATDSGSATADTNAFSIEVAAVDSTAPTLTAPTGTATGQTTATGSVSTDEANGTLYWLASANATETATTVKAGSSQAVTATGAQSVSVSGLTSASSYYLHFVHRDDSGNDSAVATSAQFTTFSVPLVVEGVRIQLFIGAIQQANLTGVTVAWFDDDDPATMGAPVYQSATETTDATGWLEIDLDGYTALAVGGSGFLIAYKAGATAEDDLLFAGRLVIEDIA